MAKLQRRSTRSVLAGPFAFLLMGLTAGLVACSAQPASTPAHAPAQLASTPASPASLPAAIASAADATPLTVESRLWTRDAGPLRGMIARVDLSSPKVHLRVTPPLEGGNAPETELEKQPSNIEAKLMTTGDFAARLASTNPQAEIAAINANYFSVAGGKGYQRGNPADILGLSVSDGRVVSPVRDYDGLGDPALLVFADHAVIERTTAASLLRRQDPAVGGHPLVAAVAGIGPSNTDTATGTAILTHGFVTASSARVDPNKRHPRTAVGVARGGRELVLLVIDGRQPGWSVGATLPELADIMLELGCSDAINLDGGGSTEFVHIRSGAVVASNRTSDPSGPRPVANHLAVVVDAK